jgi:hypothetical protein
VDQAIPALGGAMGWQVFWNSPIAAPVCIMGIFPFHAYLTSLAEKL